MADVAGHQRDVGDQRDLEKRGVIGVRESADCDKTVHPFARRLQMIEDGYPVFSRDPSSKLRPREDIPVLRENPVIHTDLNLSGANPVDDATGGIRGMDKARDQDVGIKNNSSHGTLFAALVSGSTDCRLNRRGLRRVICSAFADPAHRCREQRTSDLPHGRLHRITVYTNHDRHRSPVTSDDDFVFSRELFAQGLGLLEVSDR
mgnify:FL=1